MIKEVNFIIPVPNQSYTDVRPLIQGDSWDEIAKEASQIAYSIGNTKMGDALSGGISTPRNPGTPYKVGNTIVYFNEKDHTYTTKGGTPFLSGSTFAHLFEADFPRDTIAKKVADKTGRSVENVIEGWDSKGETSLQFGSAIHKAIETKLKYDEDANDPYLKAVTDDVVEQLGEGVKASEVFVCDPERGLCGFVDCLIQVKDKECRLIDFKTGDINKATSLTSTARELFPELKQKIISLYYLQLNFYRYILESTGYKICSMEIWAKEDEHWKMVPVPPLDIEKALDEVWK